MKCATRAAMLAGAALMSCGIACAADAAGDYPNRPIRLVLPFPPGGSTDIMARSLAQKLTESFGRQVVVDNRGGGAGGIPGTDLVAKSTPDGYVIMLSTSISHTATVSLYNKVPYDPVTDFTPITMMAFAPLLMVVNPSTPVKTVKDLIALAKASPGQINYASGGSGSSTHLPAELFKSMTGTDLVHVPYKGGGPALIGVMGGQAQVLIISMVSAMPHVKTGKLRAVALTSRERIPNEPDLPTVGETVPGFEVELWYGIYGPKGIPRPIVNALRNEIVKVLKMPDMRERLAGDGARPLGNTPEEFAVINKAEVAKWAKVVKQANIRAD